MRSGVIARKIGMTRVFDDTGKHVPVTVLQLTMFRSSPKKHLIVTATQHFNWVRVRPR